MNTHCRIARVRPKAGGAELHVIRGGVTDDGFDNALLAFFEAGAREVREGKIIGVAATLALADGSIYTGWQGDCPAFATIGALDVLKREFLDGNIEGITSEGLA
ncbi:hypothetical protein ABNQ39_00180 (plasmid) [Azospirillum sp. A26]|uniref:hypothetical protein n=1 Tax=Azospirillum sp. A26 TaxID=3160607 RepID=UPI00366D6053